MGSIQSSLSSRRESRRSNTLGLTWKHVNAALVGGLLIGWGQSGVFGAKELESNLDSAGKLVPPSCPGVALRKLNRLKPRLEETLEREMRAGGDALYEDFTAHRDRHDVFYGFAQPGLFGQPATLAQKDSRVDALLGNTIANLSPKSILIAPEAHNRHGARYVQDYFGRRAGAGDIVWLYEGNNAIASAEHKRFWLRLPSNMPVDKVLGLESQPGFFLSIAGIMREELPTLRRGETNLLKAAIHHLAADPKMTRHLIRAGLANRGDSFSTVFRNFERLPTDQKIATVAGLVQQITDDLPDGTLKRDANKCLFQADCTALVITQRNRVWIKRLKEVRQQYPDTPIVVTMGSMHTADFVQRLDKVRRHNVQFQEVPADSCSDG